MPIGTLFKGADLFRPQTRHLSFLFILYDHYAHLFSCVRPLFLLSKTPFHVFFIHTTTKTQIFCNSYTRLLQCQPQTCSIEQVHARIIVEGSFLDSFSATHLVKSYAKAGNLEMANLVFELVPNKSVFLWNAIIRAYSLDELWLEVTELYRRMEEERIEPDNFTLPFIIKAFTALLFIEDGKRVHELANRIGLVSNAYVATALIDMYVKFDAINIARKIFDEMPERDVVAWTSMISGYINCGDHFAALRVFREMRLSDEKPNWITVLSLIQACNHSIHAFIVKFGLSFSLELETAILDMYAKGGDVVSATNLFDQMPKKTLISWTAMLGGYAQNRYAKETLSLFLQMLKSSNLKPDVIVATIIVQACAQLGALNCGEMIHGYIIKGGFKSKLLVQTALVDMYSKCGSIISAERVFSGIRDRTMVSWSTMISAYGFHGFGLEALSLFEQMKRAGIMPDETAYLSVLSACSHSGLVCEGRECFESMVETLKVMPITKHYACMVDLLGRAGLVDEACALIEGMTVKPDENVWGALLSACRAKGNVGPAEYACKRLLELDPCNADYQVLLANIYAACGRWNEASKVRYTMRRGGKKTPGCSFIEVNCKIHTFFAGDRSHPQIESIYIMIELLHTFASDKQQMKMWLK